MSLVPITTIVVTVFATFMATLVFVKHDERSVGQALQAKCLFKVGERKLTQRELDSLLTFMGTEQEKLQQEIDALKQKESNQ